MGQFDFNAAVDAFRRSIQRPPNAGELAGSTDWLWMSLMRAGRKAEAAAHLASRPDTVNAGNAYTTRPRLYRGEITAAVLVKETGGEANTLGSASLGYGLGNWFYYIGETEKGIDTFRRITAGNQWSSFGYIAAEAELARKPR